MRLLAGLFNWSLAQPDNQSGIDALVKVHEQNAVGSTQILFTNDDLYIMQRSGTGDRSELVNRSEQPRDMEWHVGSDAME